MGREEYGRFQAKERHGLYRTGASAHQCGEEAARDDPAGGSNLFDQNGACLSCCIAVWSDFHLPQDFNERLYALRDLKLKVIRNIQSHNVRLAEINAQLAQSVPLMEPKMMVRHIACVVLFLINTLCVCSLQPDEIPDQRSDFDRETLIAYENEKLRAQRRAAREARKQAAGGFGGFGGGSGGGADSDEEDVASAVQHQARAAGGARMTGPRAPAEKLSALEEEERQALRTRLQYERTALLNKIAETTKAFDEALMDLRREKFKMEGDLKTTDLKLLLLYQELMLLKEFEKRDTELATVLESRRSEKAEIVAKVCMSCCSWLVVMLTYYGDLAGGHDGAVDATKGRAG